jgi:hypothetical protein
MFNTSALAGVDTTNPNQPSGIVNTFTAPAATAITSGTAQAVNAALGAAMTDPFNISPPQASKILREINALPPEKITAELLQLRQAIEKLLAERENS